VTTEQAIPKPAAADLAATADLLCFKCGDEALKPLAEELIEAYHPHLARARIVYLFRMGRWLIQDRKVPGQGMVAPAVWRLLSGCDLVVIINEAIFLAVDEKGKRAIIDHELTHFAEPRIGRMGQVTWSLRRHDVEEFSACVLRNGICMTKLNECLDEDLVQQSIIDNVYRHVTRPEIMAEVYNRPADTVIIEDEEDPGIYLCEDYIAEYGEDGRKGLEAGGEGAD